MTNEELVITYKEWKKRSEELLSQGLADTLENIEIYESTIKALEQQPCDDCISRQAAIDAIKKICPVDTEYDCTLYDKLDVMYVLKELPSVNAQAKTGQWIQQPRCEGDAQPDLVCPNCGFKISWWDMGNFCAKCGKGLEGGAG